MAAPGPWIFTNGFRQNMLNRYISGGSALTFKTILLASTSNISATSTTYAALTGELATANGYTVGGVTTVFTLSGTTNVAISLVSNPSFTATTGNIVNRYAAIIEVGGNVVCYSELDSAHADVTTIAGNTLTIDSDGTPAPLGNLA